MNVSGHKNLLAWKKSMDLVTEIYAVTKNFPKEETYSLTSQIRRSSISIPSNLAEGHAMGTTAHYMKFIFIARGSLAELETQLTIAGNLGYLSQQQLEPLISLVSELNKMLSGMIYSLRKKMDNLEANENDIPFSLSSNP